MDAYYDEIIDNCVEDDKKIINDYMDEDSSIVDIIRKIKNAEESSDIFGIIKIIVMRG